MLRKFLYRQEKNRILNRIAKGAILGGVLGAAAGFLYKTYALAIPGMRHIVKGSLVDEIIIGTVLGIFVGSGINCIIGLCITQNKTPGTYTYLNQSKLQLREEQLDISKRQVKTGEVTVHKEVLSEGKSIVVPITREELVIEKKVFNNEASNKNNKVYETIRIPISEEYIEVIKHPVVKEDVAVYKRQLQETEHIEEIIKKEKIHIKTTGDIEIKNKGT